MASQEKVNDAYRRGKTIEVGAGLAIVSSVAGLSAALLEGATASSALGLDGVVSQLMAAGLTDSSAIALSLMLVPSAVIAAGTGIVWSGMKISHWLKERKHRVVATA